MSCAAAWWSSASRSPRTDLLFQIPVRYEDRRHPTPVAQAAAGGSFTFRGRLSGLRRIFTRRRGMSLVRGVLEDGTGRLPVVWFNRPYLVNQVAAGEEYVLYGSVRQGKGGLELLNPSCERAREDEGIVAVYPAGMGKVLKDALGKVDLSAIPENLPEELLERYGLPGLAESLQALHHPPEDVDLGALNSRSTPWHLRLVYGELFELQLTLALLRERAKGERRTRTYRIDLGTLLKLSPFPLTAAQERVLGEIVDDLASPHPMLRLLQGDVGSGKTIVAALALAAALESGYQGAFMAPTELLAEQHYANLERLLGERYPLALLTGSAGGDRLRAGLASGEVRLAVGTHALIQETVEFARLGLAVIDEQHRFGVEQRALLRGKGDRPDLLVMTATPIPRSLALTA